MAMPRCFAFDDFEVDANRFELRRAGVAVEVQPKVLRLLFFLVEHRSRAVMTTELMEALWPGVHVELGSLRRAVLGARQALACGRDGQQYIQTVRGMGYRFVCDEVRESSGPDNERIAGPSVGRPAATGLEAQIGDVHVEQQGLHAEVTILLEALATKRTRGLILHGPPGIGKTHSLTQIANAVRARGMHCWFVRCSAEAGAPVLWPFMQALRMAVQEMGSDALRRLQGPYGPNLVQALEERCSPPPEQPCSVLVSAEAARFQLLDGVAQFVRRAAAQAPMVFVIDDLQFADPVSLQLMSFLLRQIRDVPLVVVGACRGTVEDGTEQAAARAEALVLLSGVDNLSHFTVPPLGAAELAAYVQQATGYSAPEAVLRHLQEQTAGNPLFVQQVLACWSRPENNGPPMSAELCDLTSPSFLVAIARHVAVVAKPCRSLLQVASVLGRRFTASHLQDLVPFPMDEILARLAQAERQRLVDSVPDRPGVFQFTHGLIRDVLYEQLEPLTRARLHGCAARAMRARGIRGDASSLAKVVRHLVAAAPLHDDGLALEYIQQAADNALSRRAYEDVVRYLEMALHLSEQLPPDAPRRVALLIRCGEAMTRTTGRRDERRLFLEAVHLAHEVGDNEGMFEAAMCLAGRPELCENDLERVSILERVLLRLSGHPEREMVIKACLAKSLMYVNAERSAALAQQALSSMPDLAEARLRKVTWMRCYDALWGVQHVRTRLRVADALRSLADREGDAAGLLHTASMQVQNYLTVADMDGVARAVSEMVSLAERLREPYYLWQATVVRGTQSLLAGNLAEAERTARAAYEQGLPRDPEGVRHVYCAQLMGPLLLQGRFAELYPYVKETHERYPLLPSWHAHIARLELALGRPDAARKRFAEIMARGLDWVRSSPTGPSNLVSLAQLCIVLNEAQAAADLYAALLPFAEYHAALPLGIGSYGPIARQLGMLAACCGDEAPAAGHFEVALAEAEKLESPPHVALCCVGYGELLQRRRSAVDRQRGIELLLRAVRLAERHDLRTVAGQARAALRASSLDATVQLAGRLRQGA